MNRKEYQYISALVKKAPVDPYSYQPYILKNEAWGENVYYILPVPERGDNQLVFSCCFNIHTAHELFRLLIHLQADQNTEDSVFEQYLRFSVLRKLFKIKRKNLSEDWYSFYERLNRIADEKIEEKRAELETNWSHPNDLSDVVTL